MNPIKRQYNISVEATFNPGYPFKVRPTAFYLDVDGFAQKITIDRVVGEIKKASLKLGRTGIRYTCRVREKIIYLYYDDNDWHFEAME